MRNITCLFSFLHDVSLLWFRLWSTCSTIVTWLMTLAAVTSRAYPSDFCGLFCFTRFPSSLLSWPTWHLHIGWRLRLAGISWPLLHSLHWHHAMIICLVVVFNWIAVSYVIFRCFWAEKNYSDDMSTRDTRQLPISARTSSSLYINSEPLVPLCHLKAILSIPNSRAFLYKINILVKFF